MLQVRHDSCVGPGAQYECLVPISFLFLGANICGIFPFASILESSHSRGDSIKSHQP